MEKNNYNQHHRNISASSMGATSTATATATSGKTKIWEEATVTQQQDAGVDELLAVLGYKVRSSDMAEVAQKLEQLEMVMGNAQEDGFGLLSHLSSETVHYNPSDLSTWLESMLSEINPSTDFVVDASSSDSTILAGAGGANDPFLAPAESSTVTTIDFTRRSCSNINNKIYEEPSSSNYDLSAIPGEVVYGGEREKKRLKQEAVVTSVSVSVPDSSSSSVGPRVLTESTRPVVLVDSQETGIRLVHTLMACAEAVQQDKFNLADALLKQIGLLAVSQAGAMRKVAMYFADALARRVYRLYPTPSPDSSLSDVLQMHFYDSCPYLQFAHFTANQAILEAFAGKTTVHVIDFGLKQGTQWPSLIQALALRPEGPTVFRLTGIGPPQLDNSDPLQQVGWKLARFAENLRVEFEFRGFVANCLADLDASMLEIRPGETVAVNSVFELHQLLARPGAIQKVFGLIKETRPTIVTVVEQEANHNGPVFLDRFTEALHYYSTLFDSLEGCSGSGSATGSVSGSAQDLVMTEMYFGQQISNVVACEGVDRVERHETLAQWRNRFSSAGFVPVPLGSNGFKQASALLSFCGGGGDGYKVEENQGCLTLGWYTRPLIATSAWQLAPKSQK